MSRIPLEKSKGTMALAGEIRKLIEKCKRIEAEKKQELADARVDIERYRGMFEVQKQAAADACNETKRLSGEKVVLDEDKKKLAAMNMKAVAENLEIIAERNRIIAMVTKERDEFAAEKERLVSENAKLTVENARLLLEVGELEADAKARGGVIEEAWDVLESSEGVAPAPMEPKKAEAASVANILDAVKS